MTASNVNSVQNYSTNYTIEYYIINTVAQTTIIGISGYLGSRFILNINPTIGLVFGCAFGLANIIVEPLLDKLMPIHKFNNPKNHKRLHTMVHIALKVAVAIAAVFFLLGVSLTAGKVLALLFITLLIGFTFNIILNTALAAINKLKSK